MLIDIEKMLIEGNFRFQSKINQNLETNLFDQRNSKYPILFLTCMDTRIDIHRIFQLNSGDAFILRNAGNICTLDMMRSILITIHKYEVKYIIVLGHTDCGMAKINISELREELPFELFKQLSTKHSDFLSNLYDFFKPFDNEISNVIQQINDLHAIKPFFPNVDIIGMIYDTRTGWIFKQDDFRDLLIKENHNEIYERLLTEKKQLYSKFLEERNPYQVSKEKVEKTLLSNSKLQEEPENLELKEEKINSIIINNHQKSNDLENIGFQIMMPKIRIPKIYIPQLKIYEPRKVKIKDD